MVCYSTMSVLYILLYIKGPSLLIVLTFTARRDAYVGNSRRLARRDARLTGFHSKSSYYESEHNMHNMVVAVAHVFMSNMVFWLTCEGEGHYV